MDERALVMGDDFHERLWARIRAVRSVEIDLCEEDDARFRAEIQRENRLLEAGRWPGAILPGDYADPDDDGEMAITILLLARAALRAGMHAS
jgi:hypothetical protein